MKTTTIKNNKGWTLTEVMVTMAILSILFFVVNLFAQLQRSIVSNAARIELERESKTAMSTIIRQLHQGRSDSITITQDSGAPIFSRVNFLNLSGSTVTFRQNGVELVMSVDNNPKILSKNLKSISFGLPRSFELDSVDISLALEKSIGREKKYTTHVASKKVRVLN